MELNLEPKEGFLNRHIHKLPDNKEVIIRLIDNDGNMYVCGWLPKKLNEFQEQILGYLGTARVINGYYKGIGFNLFEQNNSEFVYYQLLDFTPIV